MLKPAAYVDSLTSSSLFPSPRGISGGGGRSSRSAMLWSCSQLLAVTLLLVMTACGKSAKDPFAKFPTITSQPANQSVTVGQTATFSVTATSTVMPFTYQWFDNGTAIAGATSSTYTTPAAAIGDNSSQFKVTVSNTSGSATSNPATLTVTVGLPMITTQPANQSVTVGQTATFSVTATSTVMPLTYQWFDKGTAIAGATSSTFTTPATTAGDNSSQFTVTVSNTSGSVTSNPATLTVTAGVPPAITAQPTSVNVCTHASTTLSVSALNAGTYQWFLNGSPIGGATSSSYFIASAAATDAGSYTVAVTNAAGTVTSQAATVSVGTSITTNPMSLSIAQGQTAAFSVAAAGEAPFSYQWYLIASGTSSGVAISGATSSTYTTPVEGVSSSGSNYYATVTDTCGNALTSTSATLTVTTGNVPPTIVTQPVSQTVASGSTATFTVTASGPGTLTYQWYRIPAGMINGVAISGATGTTYTVPASSTALSNDQDGYYVIVVNSYGQATSQTAILSIGNGIQITKQPVSVYVSAGQPATFSVTATSLLPLTYQWFEAAAGTSTFTAIAGATGASYTQATTATTDSGSVFYVVVSNGSSTPVTSTSVLLSVGPLGGISNFCSGWAPVAGSTTTPTPNANCEVQLSSAANDQSSAIVWPNLIPTGNLQLSFTFTTTDASTPPADGFAMTLGDPSLGATTSSIGTAGSGLGAETIPGVVLVFDDYRDGPDPAVPYIAVGRGEGALWEKPYTLINGNIPPLATAGATVSHDYVVSIVQGMMTVTMDGQQLFSGSVAVPPVAYLYFSAATGRYYEQTTVSNFSATVGAPSN
ncbi:hypothetical protein RBB75_14420 [Tunturibacter empetritectus]|uniref:Ig-like domain-containing protein n=1 Tax=Tunturiibacter empetritectus TaxID=3069691 RepID=A0AAU7Z9V4_9BACT